MQTLGAPYWSKPLWFKEYNGYANRYSDWQILLEASYRRILYSFLLGDENTVLTIGVSNRLNISIARKNAKSTGGSGVTALGIKKRGERRLLG